jgi:hypothetical protein
MVLSVVVWLFAAIVVVGAAGFVVLDAMDKVESIRKRAPWITKILKRRGALLALLMICTVLLIGDGYELLTKEVPEISAPPNVTLTSPPSPRITIYKLPQPIKERCWVLNYAAPAIPPPPSWGLATIFCNTTIKPPYSVELDYDQPVTIGPFTFPVGSEFANQKQYKQGSKVVTMFDLHTIIPNEPFSIMASSSTGKFPLVKTATIRAKGLVFDFHP